tara:strand:+ start:40 stop:348 length:309 start_codon:yes stop_codon:yes gene_type:complete
VLYEACGDTVEVKILETIEVLNRGELQHHEVRYLKKYQGITVNRNMPYRNRKQHYQDNIVEMREYHVRDIRKTPRRTVEMGAIGSSSDTTTRRRVSYANAAS